MKRVITPSTEAVFAADSQCTTGHLDMLKKSFATQHQLNLLQTQLSQSAAQPVVQPQQTNSSGQAGTKSTKAS